jgi:hypothetical protein
MDPIASVIKSLSTSIESISKRLRRVEVLARLSSDTGIDEFLELVDVDEDTYLGNAGLFVHVKLDESGLEFSPVGSACVTFICGSPGWRGYGGNPIRTLIHENAFQLDAEGDDRGVRAVDLQQYRSNDNEVAGALASFTAGEENRITPNAEYSAIIGAWNRIYNAGVDDPWGCFILGTSSDIFDDSAEVFILGDSIAIEDCFYGLFSGYGHETSDAGTASDGAFGVFAFLEDNHFIHNGLAGSQYPTYTGSLGIGCYQEGDVWLTFMLGESQYAYGEAPEACLYNLMVGYGNYLAFTRRNFILGDSIRSAPPGSTDNYYDARIVWSESANKWPSSPSPSPSNASGYNQSSLFSQIDLILSWPAAFTTSRFEFPIMVDSIWYFEAYVAGTEQGCNNSYAWKIEGVVENDGGTTTILVQTVTNVYRDVVTKEWQAAADDANDRLIFQYRDTAGPDLTDCNIQFMLRTVEVGWAA